jgi:hypothetical protein
MDITETIAPRSDQMNAEDLLTGPRTFTVESVTRGSAEQPVEIHLVGFPGRPFKPSKTVRRILVAAWGSDADAYVGRRMTLYRDPAVRFGKDEVGGIRVSHLSDIDKRIQLALTVTRGKRAPFIVDPLPPVPDAIVTLEHRIAEAATLADLDAIAAELKGGDLGEHRARIQSAWKAKHAALKSTPAPTGDDYGDLLDAAADEAGR